ncbi:MAG: DUF177 domain-containing protein [Bacteroidia bacterium]|nr:DUF177 domain-containing protein [Bacteroidia bacterium]MCC6768997.1 DUF177 domain-containing protein [Bacteroidia bacterium]
MTKALDQYIIQFSGLSVGKHAFDFQADEQFFAAIEGTMIENGQLQIGLELEKTTQFMNFQFNISGTVEVACDRCAINWQYPLDIQPRLILRFAENPIEDADPDIIYISRSEYQFNISHHLYEYIATSLPFHIVPCEISGNQALCDQQTLARLNNHQGDSTSEGSDPRWDALKNL